MGYKPHIRGRREEREEKERNPQYILRWRVEEEYHSRKNRFRKLAVKYEKKTRNYRALVEFACAVIRRSLYGLIPCGLPRLKVRI
ncbi:MAG: hypothetical protein LBP81_06935 [Treponema sp.]|jgi:transposase|nr:hypothetical protein [Treponema sp.]